MEVLHPHCAGLDVHKDTVVACVRHMDGWQGKPRRQDVQDDDPGTDGTVGLAVRARMHAHRHGGDGRLLEAGVAHSLRRRVRTGAGQRCSCEERAGAQDRRERRHLAGRPDGAWADPRQLCARANRLSRCATCCARASSSCASAAAISQRIQKTLEDANIKLDSVITDIVGLSGRRMIEALIAGQTDPQALAALAHRRIRATAAENWRRRCAAG